MFQSNLCIKRAFWQQIGFVPTAPVGFWWSPQPSHPLNGTSRGLPRAAGQSSRGWFQSGSWNLVASRGCILASGRDTWTRRPLFRSQCLIIAFLPALLVKTAQVRRSGAGGEPTPEDLWCWTVNNKCSSLSSPVSYMRKLLCSQELWEINVLSESLRSHLFFSPSIVTM